MVNFTCQLEWPEGCSESWSEHPSGCSHIASECVWEGAFVKDAHRTLWTEQGGDLPQAGHTVQPAGAEGNEKKKEEQVLSS